MYLRERPNAEQWQIVAWMFIVALAILGSVGLWIGFRVPAEKADIGRQLVWLGGSAWAAAVLVLGFKRLIELFLA